MRRLFPRRRRGRRGHRAVRVRPAPAAARSRGVSRDLAPLVTRLVRTLSLLPSHRGRPPRPSGHVSASFDPRPAQRGGADTLPPRRQVWCGVCGDVFLRSNPSRAEVVGKPAGGGGSQGRPPPGDDPAAHLTSTVPVTLIFLWVPSRLLFCASSQLGCTTHDRTGVVWCGAATGS